MNREMKRQSLEAQKKRWMQDREQTLGRSRGEEITSPPIPNKSNNQVGKTNQQNNSRTLPKGREDRSSSSSSSSSAAAGTTTNLLDESLVSQLTERITKELRKEINLGIGSTDIREAMTEKMDKYLESELHTHMCKICSQLMLSPNNTPMLLFPCGHTFCKMCCDKGRKISNCPYCRHEVQSMTINQSLKDLIDQFASQREKMRKGSNEMFRPDSQEYSDPRASSRYQAKYRACEMRREILINELQDEKIKTLDKLLKKKKSLRTAEAHLLDERKVVEEKIKQLHEEIDLIDTHLQDQRTKIAEVEELEASSRNNVALLEKSVLEIENEMEKLNILASQHSS